MDVRDRHVLITGASRGIGQALAEIMQARGARVSAVARSVPEQAGPAGTIASYPTDLCDQDALAELLPRVEKIFGPVDVLINNAGVPHIGTAWQQSADQVRNSVLLNVLAPFELARQVVPGMLDRRRGRIVSISSFAGVAAFPTLAVYGATKAALALHTTTLDWELRRTPVDCLLVELGEVADTFAATSGREQSPVVARSVDRMSALRVAPTLTVDTVARSIADAIREDRRHLVLPRRFTLLATLRRASTAVNKLMLAGIAPGPEIPGRTP